MTAAMPLPSAADALPAPILERPRAPFTLAHLRPGAPSATQLLPALPALPAISYVQAVTTAAGYEAEPDQLLAPEDVLPLVPAVWRAQELFPTQEGLEAAVATLTRFATWLP